MNDYLLESQKRERKPVAEKIKINEMAPDTGGIQLEQPRSPTKNSTAYKILTIEREAKINVTFNNICIILFLTLFPFGVIISTFANVNWFIMVEGKDYYYWVNFFFIRKTCIQGPESTPINAIPPLCQNSWTVYSLFMPFFYLDGCDAGELTRDDPSNLCAAMVSYYYSGFFAGVTVFLGLVLHMLHIWQLMRITFSRDPNLIKGLHPLRVAYFVIFFYLAPPIYWLFGSATIINTNSPKPFYLRFGTSLYCYAGAFVFFTWLVIWFRRVYKKGIRRNLVNTLLNAEKKYANDFESTSKYDHFVD